MKKFTVEEDMKAQRVIEEYLYCFLDLDAGRGWVVNATPRPL